jgi:hypothetical protein
MTSGTTALALMPYVTIPTHTKVSDEAVGRAAHHAALGHSDGPDGPRPDD